MAVKRPKIPQSPSTPLPKGAKRPKAVNLADAVYNPPSRKRVKGYEQTQTPRTKDLSTTAGFSAQAPAVRAVRPRGSGLGQYADAPERSEDWAALDGRIPQIDPTATSNPPRPRTLRAGYIRANLPGSRKKAETGTLWVVFRDGTPWEYENVPNNVWRNFRRVKSPGRFINRVLNNYDYHRGEF